MINKWEIIFYIDPQGSNPVQKFLDKLTKKQQSKVIRILLHIQEYGLISVIPHLKKLTGTPFWEIRILGKDNIRIFYVTFLSNKILLLHGFIKKEQKTSITDIQIALRRYKEYQPS